MLYNIPVSRNTMNPHCIYFSLPAQQLLDGEIQVRHIVFFFSHLHPAIRQTWLPMQLRSTKPDVNLLITSSGGQRESAFLPTRAQLSGGLSSSHRLKRYAVRPRDSRTTRARAVSRPTVHSVQSSTDRPGRTDPRWGECQATAPSTSSLPAV